MSVDPSAWFSDQFIREPRTDFTSSAERILSNALTSPTDASKLANSIADFIYSPETLDRVAKTWHREFATRKPRPISVNFRTCRLESLSHALGDNGQTSSTETLSARFQFTTDLGKKMQLNMRVKMSCDEEAQWTLCSETDGGVWNPLEVQEDGTPVTGVGPRSQTDGTESGDESARNDGEGTHNGRRLRDSKVETETSEGATAVFKTDNLTSTLRAKL